MCEAKEIDQGEKGHRGEEVAVLKRFLCLLVPGLLAVPLSGVLLTSPVLAAGGVFGPQSVEIGATEKPTAEQLAKHEAGLPDTQAGSHPYALTTGFVLNESEELGNGEFQPAGNGPRDVRVELPPGFVGNPNAVPKCSYHVFTRDECPNDTAIGEATTIVASRIGYTSPITGKHLDEWEYVANPVYNVEPPGGVAQELGWVVKETTPFVVDASVRTGGDYGVTAVSRAPQSVVVQGAKVTIWGVPSEASHSRIRGKCLAENLTLRQGIEEGHPYDEEESVREYEESHGVIEPKAPAECAAGISVEPYLTNPTSCGVPRTATLSMSSWEEPGVFDSKVVGLPALSGCEKLAFSPSLSVTPDGSAGSTPTGLSVGVHVDQESTTNPVGLGEADVKDTTVALPAGVQVSPSAADGLEACSLAQIGFKGENPETGAQEFTPEQSSCPAASKIANVHIKTPLLEGELTGAVYLAAPQNFLAGPLENPFKSLIAMYLVAEEPATGVLVKLPGEVELGQEGVANGLEPGQIRTTFKDTPQLPFSDLKLEFYGTSRAPLATPALCGTYNTSSSFEPWSGTAAVSPPASFDIESGPELETASGPRTTPCADPLAFAPTLSSGATNNNAGAFSSLTTTLSREDGQQSISQVTLHYPPGLSGLLSGVKLCGEAEANAGTCGPESEIGETTVSVGLGGDPFSVLGGKVYITGPYEGAPFGLSIVNPAKAGPFDLQEGRPVIVRAKIEVNPTTAALTVTTNTAAEGYAIPPMIEGIPLQIKHVNVNVTRPGFTFNPTSCNKMEVTGSVESAEGASSPVSIPFQAANCANLKFAPDFTVSTSGNTSKADGASLTTRVTYPPSAAGTYANVGYVKVELPKALPSRLTTLQKACLAAQFEANPAGCPPASFIGHAVVHTPLIPVPLEGPAIFVSHGGEAFPSLTMVLQGYGVKIDLVGTTFISKTGITSTTFKTVPDQPFSSFELTLPEGPYSALAANGNLCAQKLVMPNEFVGQNGAVIRENTNITVEGCKPAIRVVSHKVNGKTATIVVSVPGSGKLTATGKGISKGTGKASRAQNVIVKVTLSKAQQALVARHHGRRLKVQIKIVFTPKSGSKLATTTTVLLK